MIKNVIANQKKKRQRHSRTDKLQGKKGYYNSVNKFIRSFNTTKEETVNQNSMLSKKPVRIKVIKRHFQ